MLMTLNQDLQSVLSKTFILELVTLNIIFSVAFEMFKSFFNLLQKIS